jgi:hypothetical protein
MDGEDDPDWVCAGAKSSALFASNYSAGVSDTSEAGTSRNRAAGRMPTVSRQRKNPIVHSAGSSPRIGEERGGLVFLRKQQEVITTSAMVEWKERVITEGMRLIEEERKQTDAMQLLLQKRIEALSDELEMTRRERDELMEVAEDLAMEREMAEQSKPSETIIGKPQRSAWRLCSLMPPWLCSPALRGCGSRASETDAPGGKKASSLEPGSGSRRREGMEESEEKAQGRPGLRLSGSFEWSL